MLFACKKEWRDCTNAESSPDYRVEANMNREIAAFYLALPDDMIFETSIFEKMTVTEKTLPWKYQETLQEHFTGQDNVMPKRQAVFQCTQHATENITEYETHIRGIARKTKFEEMADPFQELMKDRFCTGIHNTNLRELYILLHHYKVDSKTPFTFEEQLTRAKAWEAAHNTNVSIMQSDKKTDAEVNFTGKSWLVKASRQPRTCGRCRENRHPRKGHKCSRSRNYIRQ
eukprot:GHVT01001531.1.p1 GENE.GHVT01001531.1~~GHVT01001531.1.p1  ORF type:complete len:229 (+),score=11.20 GHVT01001531.1:218-904(+)